MKQENIQNENAKPNPISLLEKINPLILLNHIFPYFNKENKFILPLLLSYSNPNFITKLKDKASEIIADTTTPPEKKISIQDLITIYNFLMNCKSLYKEKFLSKELEQNVVDDPISDLFETAEKQTEKINDSSINFKKIFYNFLLTTPVISLSPCSSLMNSIYWNEYYKPKDNFKKQKVKNVILNLKESAAEFKINDIFKEIIFGQHNYSIKNKAIYFDGKLFMNVINNIYKLFNNPEKIIVNGGDKNIKHNFNNKTEFIMESILFKLNFKSNSLLIIYRV